MTIERTFKTVTDFWTEAFRDRPDRPFLVHDGRSRSYAEIEREARQLAGGLAGLGVRPGDRVALWMSNLPEWVITQCAVTLMGAVLVPLNTRLREADLGPLLANCGARVLVTQSSSPELDYLALVESILDDGAAPDLEQVVVVANDDPVPAQAVSWSSLVTHATPLVDVHEAALDELCYILYTSGTTAMPKGVMLSHRNLNNSTRLARDMRPGDVLLLEFPLFAITGCHNAVLAGIQVGATLILHTRFRAEEAIELIEQHRVTVFAGLDQVIQSVVNSPEFHPSRVSSLRLAATFPRRPEHRGLYEAAGLTQASTGYGMTETSGPLTMSINLDEELTNEGPPHSGNIIEIRGLDGRCLPTGEVGMIAVRSSQVMLGYYGNPEATAAVIDQDGVFHTGDIGRMNADGTLTWVGRSKDIYKCSGFNVAVMEVESFLRTHPDLTEAAVVPVPHPSKGQVGAAFVQRRAGSTIDSDDIVAFCREHIASYKVPGTVTFVEEFPRTASGKIRKVALERDLDTVLG